MKKLIYLSAFALLALTACKEKAEKTEEPVAEETVETPQPENEWITLFDGSNLDSWHAYNGEAPTQWKIEGENLVFTPAENQQGSQNLVTNETFENFELSLDWKISEGGNSGIMWAVQENDSLSEPYLTGPEIQILDDERHPDAKAGTTHRAGALYDMIAAPEGVVKPAGEWNSYVITIDYENNKGVVVLNDTEVVSFPVSGPEWDAMVAESKFADWPLFGKSQTGHIALQDHGNMVTFRDIKIKKL